MKCLLYTLLFTLACSLAWAQSPIIVNGTVQSPSGQLATSGYVEFDLAPLSSGLLYSVVGTTVLAPQKSKCGINASGQLKNLALSGSCLIWPNDLIKPANSLYTVKIAPSNAIVNTISNVFLSSANPTADLSNLTILSPTQVIGTVVSGSPLVTATIVPSLANTWSVGSKQLPYVNGFFTNLTLNYLYPTPLTVAQLVALGHTVGRLSFVTDFNGSCTVGGGPSASWCYDTGTGYLSVGGSSGPIIKGISFIIPSPSVNDTGSYQYEFFGPSITLVEVDCSTDAGTVGINFDLRGINSSNTLGPQIFSSTFVCDTAGEVNTQFVSSTVNTNQILTLDVVSVTGTPNVVRIHVKHQ